MPRRNNNRHESSRSMIGASRWHIGRVFTDIDAFGQQVPGLNLQGETRINTSIGGALSCLIYLLTLSYAAIKFVHL